MYIFSIGLQEYLTNSLKKITLQKGFERAHLLTIFSLF